MTNTDSPDKSPGRWSRAAIYESYVGRWSRNVAREFVGWLQPKPGAIWLDVGCGTGALSQTILAMADPSAVKGVDPSAPFLAHAQERINDPRFTSEVGDARALPVPNEAFDMIVGGLMLNFVPAAEQEKAVREMRRAGKPGGTVAVYVWDYSGGMQLMRYFWDAAVALDPAVRHLEEGLRFALCNPEPLGALFNAAGLIDVDVRAIDIPTVFTDFDDYWTPFLGGQGPAPEYTVSLDEDRRNALRDSLRATLPIEPDGSIHLIARAWAVQGTIPTVRN